MKEITDDDLGSIQKHLALTITILVLAHCLVILFLVILLIKRRNNRPKKVSIELYRQDQYNKNNSIYNYQGSDYS